MDERTAYLVEDLRAEIADLKAKLAERDAYWHEQMTMAAGEVKELRELLNASGDWKRNANAVECVREVFMERYAYKRALKEIVESPATEAGIIATTALMRGNK